MNDKAQSFTSKVFNSEEFKSVITTVKEKADEVADYSKEKWSPMQKTLDEKGYS